MATKVDAIEDLSVNLLKKQAVPDMNIDENTQLANQLETSKQGNDGLKATIEDLEAKNTDYAEELENLLSSLRDLVDQNSELDVPAEHLVDANRQPGEDMTPI